MKIIDKRKAQQDPYVAKTFRREAKLLQMVRHPNILQLFEVIETDTNFYLISELCSGEHLDCNNLMYSLVTLCAILEFTFEYFCLLPYRGRADEVYLQEAKAR